MANVETAYWLTTHWPPLETTPRENQNFYLQDIHKAGCRIKVGDKVLIYELKSGPALVKNGKAIKRYKGAMAVVAAADVVDPLREQPADAARQIYKGRKPTYWKWFAKTKTTARGHVPRETVNEILGHGKGNYFRGFNHGKGYQEIEPGQYAAIAARLNPTK